MNTKRSTFTSMKNTVSFNPDNLYTKQAYHVKTKIARSTIDKKIIDKSIRSMKINGAVIIIKD